MMSKKKKLVPSKEFNRESNGLRLVTLDIETAPLLMYEFGLYGEKSGNFKNIQLDWYVISVAWKVLGEDTVEAVSVIDDMKRFRKNPNDDYHVVKKVHEVLSTADIIIGHNLDGFDWKKLNTRFLVHGLGPLPRARSVDTWKVAKREFAFTSNKLDYIGQHLGLGEKMETPRGMWPAAVRGDIEAIKTMVEYNKQDVELTEKVYLKLRPFDTAHANLSTAEHNGTCACPKCNSENIQKRGYSYTNAGKFQRFQCSDCGGWSRGRDNLLAPKHNDGVKPSLLYNK